MNKKFNCAISLFAALVLTACGGGGKDKPKTYTYREFVSVSPSNWNELTYQDANDTEIMSYIAGSFFTFNYKFDAQGKIVDGAFEVEYDGAKDLEDVTETYAGDPKYSVPADATKGFAYKITLRDDLKWDDGTPIAAKDFVYTMKQQEDPLFQNYRADSYYNGATVIHNAMQYVKQGQSGWFQAKEVFGGVYNESEDAGLIFHCAAPLKENDPYGGAKSYIVNYLNKYIAYIEANGFAWLLDALGWGSPITQAEFDALEGKSLAEIKADATLKASWDALIGWWQTDPGEELDFFVNHYTYPELSFDEVGIFVGENQYELIIVLDKSLQLLKDDGTLAYTAAYNMNSLPLVKESLYEANKVEPQIEGGLWTSKYNSSVETSASWGPYKLTSFQAGKQFILERNPNWYGYGMDAYKGQYQTDKIICDTIAEWNTAFLAFKNGDIQGIGIDVSVADEYKNSKRAVFTPDDFVGSLQLQSDATALAARSDSSHNKLMLKYVDFRKALSLAIDRADYTNKCTTSSLAGFGLFNSMHYYDVANGGVYRNEDVAKQVICDVYGVNVDEYPSLDEAYAAVTGYNLELAKELLNKAYDEAVAAGDIKAGDTVVLTVGASVDNEATRRQFNYLKAAFEKLAEGTKLDGHLTLDFDSSFGDQWADDFRDGAYDICTGGWTGAAWDPGYFLLAYLSPDYMYSKAWDTSAEMLTFNPWGDDNDEHNLTMSLIDWYNALNGKSGAYADWSAGAVADEFRLGIIAALEKAILSVYYTVPLQYRFGASLLSYKVEYASRTYNTFMGYGGIRYMTYNYDDEAWEAIKGTFDYTK